MREGRADHLRALLLDLVGTARKPDLGALSQADWTLLQHMAAQHRLLPLLHARHGADPALPPAIAATWREAHRASAFAALLREGELRATCTLLEAGGFAPIALKGAWLARHAYPEPAQRPSRDIDLLLDPETVLAAFDLLQDAGYVLEEAPEMPLADVIRLEKHLPPLLAPRGTRIELHHLLWEPTGRLDHATPAARDAAVRARARREADGIAYPAPEDMLAHLIVHAAYSHRFDCGPLLIPDLAFLLSRHPVDWAAFWARAAEEGWHSGARLALELVARHCPETRIDFTADPGEPAPAGLVEAMPTLLLQDLDTRASAAVAASAIKAGPGALWARLHGRRAAEGEAQVRRDMTSEGGFLGWAGSRLVRTISQLASTEVRRQSRDLARLSKWLDT